MRKRMIRTQTMLLAGPPERVFPLLCPVREYEWIETWACEMIYTESGFAERDCVFTTSTPGGGEGDVWVTSRYEPSRIIEFVRVNALRAIRYTITLAPNGDGTTRAEWSQIITGLTAAGDEFVGRCTIEEYKTLIGRLESMLNHFLRTGEMLRPPRG
jgi:hypothetical protein